VLAPKANAYAKRWVRTVRTDCLDWLLIVGRSHLEQVLRVYVQHYNGHRPHRALGLAAPDPPAGLTVVSEDRQGRVRRRDLLGGLLHEYRRAARTRLRILQSRPSQPIKRRSTRPCWRTCCQQHGTAPIGTPITASRQITVG
jgi:Integrase core domain